MQSIRAAMCRLDAHRSLRSPFGSAAHGGILPYVLRELISKAA